MMEQQEGLIEGIVNKVDGYSKTSLAHIRLKAVQKVIPVATAVTSQVLVMSVFTMFALLFNIGISLWIGELLGKPWYGFLAVAGFYLLLAIILHFVLAKWLRKPVGRFIIKQALN